MCGRYGLVSNPEKMRRIFKANPTGELLEKWKGSYNISPGMLCPVITSENRHDIQLFSWGFKVSYSPKIFLINARAEGSNNIDNAPNFKGGAGIIQTRTFMRSIREFRCLIPADYFFEGPIDKKLSEPYLCFVREKKPFAFAGIYNSFQDKEGKTISTFAIITTWPNELMQKIGHHRTPVILPENKYDKWLKQTTQLTEITQMLQPMDSRYMNAFRVSDKIKNAGNNTREFIEPIGPRILNESTDYVYQRVRPSKKEEREGLGRRSVWAERPKTED